MLDREPLDVAAALQRIGGDEDLLREIAELCLEEYPKLLREIREAIAGHRAKDLERGAHSLKGVVANFAAEAARQAAFTLELMGRSGNLTDAPAALTALELELAGLHAALELIVRH